MDRNWRIHPGDHLAEYLEVRAMTSSDLACAVDEDVGVIDAIVSGEGRVTPDIAVGLERVFGLKAYIWEGLQATWDGSGE